jgi:hypothetical protein
MIERTGYMKRILLALIMLSTGIEVPHADQIISDSALGYSIYLPTDSWVRVVKTAAHHQFYDTAFVYKSQISIVRHAYSTSDFPTPESWTRANFIAYKLCVEFSFEPFGAMLYYDTMPTVRQGISWATESYTMFFTIDTTLGAWSEYTRYTARGAYGWEIYAIGDTADMMENIGVYVAILKLVTLPGDTNARIVSRDTSPVPISYTARSALGRQRIVFDPLGRRRSFISGRDGVPSGVLIQPLLQRATIIVK